MKVFVVDTSICNGCYACQIVCKDEHCANDWMPYAKPQPDMGHFWLKQNEYVRGNVPQVKMTYIPVMCQQCENAPCKAACPVEGAIYYRDDGLILIDPKKCSGCMNCVDACPYGAIYYNSGLEIAQKCTGCAHLIDRGWKMPRCADACPTGALQFGEEADMAALMEGGGPLHPEFGLKTRAVYKNLPMKFIAGTVYDPTALEVVVGATCTLTGEGDNLTQETNHWGDFWFDGLKEGKYSLKIDAAGKSKTIADISTAKDVGLGDIALE